MGFGLDRIAVFGVCDGLKKIGVSCSPRDRTRDDRKSTAWLAIYTHRLYADADCAHFEIIDLCDLIHIAPGALLHWLCRTVSPGGYRKSRGLPFGTTT